MPLVSSGQIKLSDIRNEFGLGSGQIAMSSLHGKGNAASSGQIQMAANFYGTSSATLHANTTITVALGGSKTNLRGVEVGSFGSIASTAIANSSNQIDEVYHDGLANVFRFHLKTSTAYTAWTYIEIVNGSTITRFNRANASLSSHGITGAIFHHWSSTASGSPSTSMNSVTIMGGVGNTVGFKIVQT